MLQITARLGKYPRISLLAWLTVIYGLLLVSGCERTPQVAASSAVPCSLALKGGTPWYNTVAPFEGGNDSGRTHVFGFACASTDLKSGVVVAARAEQLPDIYNVVTRSADEIFVLGGIYGLIGPEHEPYVAGLDAHSLQLRWRTALPGLNAGDWNYPGALGIHANGDLYVTYGRFLARLDPATGALKGRLELPTNQSASDVAYNGFVLLSDGRIVAKSIHRKPGCPEPDFMAFLVCEVENLAASTVVLVDAEKLAVVQTLIAPEHVRFRATSTRFEDHEFVYMPGEARIYRYRYAGGALQFDESWQPGYRMPQQTPGTAVAVLKDWVVIQTSGIPAEGPLSIVAISQRDAKRQWRIEPFAQSGARGSFIPSLPTVDPENRRVYTFDAYAGELAALDFDDDKGFSLAWQVPQRSFAFSALVGPPDARVLVGSDLSAILPGLLLKHLGVSAKLKLMRHASPQTEDIVWRDARTGQELGRVPHVAAVSGSVPTPGFEGSIYVPDVHGQALVRLAAGQHGAP